MSFTSYTVDNDRLFADAIKRASGVVSDFRIPFGLILADFYKSEQAIFSLQGPGKYPPFKNSTVTYKTTRTGTKRYVETSDKSPYQKHKLRRYGFDYPLMLASGRLAESLTQATAPDSIAENTPTYLKWGSRTPYLIYHQSDLPRHIMPLRKVLFIGPEAPSFATSEQMGRPERWLNIINDFTLKQLKRTGAFKP